MTRARQPPFTANAGSVTAQPGDHLRFDAWRGTFPQRERGGKPEMPSPVVKMDAQTFVGAGEQDESDAAIAAPDQLFHGQPRRSAVMVGGNVQMRLRETESDADGGKVVPRHVQVLSELDGRCDQQPHRFLGAKQSRGACDCHVLGANPDWLQLVTQRLGALVGAEK